MIGLSQRAGLGSRVLALLAMVGIAWLIVGLRGVDPSLPSHAIDVDSLDVQSQVQVTDRVRRADNVRVAVSTLVRDDVITEQAVNSIVEIPAPSLEPDQIRVLSQQLDELHALFAGKGDVADDDAAKAAWERAWLRVTALLQGAVGSDPGVARWVRAYMDEVGDADFAIRLARILRKSDDKTFLSEMSRRVTEAVDPMARRTALLVLESKAPALWLQPVSETYLTDSEPTVRDEAAGVLGRSLVDPGYVSNHREIRATIQAGLDDIAPAVRTLALNSMLADRTAGMQDLERARALLNDSDEGVRNAAQCTVRVLERVLQRRRGS